MIIMSYKKQIEQNILFNQDLEYSLLKFSYRMDEINGHLYKVIAKPLKNAIIELGKLAKNI